MPRTEGSLLLCVEFLHHLARFMHSNALGWRQGELYSYTFCEADTPSAHKCGVPVLVCESMCVRVCVCGSTHMQVESLFAANSTTHNNTVTICLFVYP